MTNRTLDSLSEAGKEELALALLLWRDFKANGRYDPRIAIQMFELAQMLGVEQQLHFLMANLPPMKIEPR